MELGGTCENSLYDKWGIIVIHLWEYNSKPFVFESNYHIRTMVTYLPAMGTDTPHLQVHSVLT